MTSAQQVIERRPEKKKITIKDAARGLAPLIGESGWAFLIGATTSICYFGGEKLRLSMFDEKIN